MGYPMKYFILILFFSVATFGNSLVESKADFDRHLALHRKRVLVLGLALRERFYPHIDVKELKTYLKYHDIAKTDLVNGNLKTSIDELYKYYGTRLPTDQESKLQHLVDSINLIDRKIALMFLENFRSSEQNREIFKRIERVSDLVDRGLDPVASEEFGKPLLKASELLAYMDEIELDQVKWLEKNYQELTEQFQYKKECKHVLGS